MATWIEGVRSAQRIIEQVEECMRANCLYFFRNVDLYPYRTNGGRSDGVTAWFEIKKDSTYKHICVSVYEHWNTDNICLKFSEFVPMNMDENHDIPSVQFPSSSSTSVQAVVLAIQLFLTRYFDLPIPTNWEVPTTYKGCGTVDTELYDWVNDRMHPIFVNWFQPDFDDE